METTKNPAMTGGRRGVSEIVQAGKLNTPNCSETDFRVQGLRRLYRGPISTFSDGFFDPAEDGPEALIFDVADRDGAIIDQVAWLHGKPNQWWLRRGAAALLGEEALDDAIWEDRPLRLVSTPLAHINSDREAACILDWRADVYSLLFAAPSIVCESDALAARLLKAFDRPRLRVSVERGARRAA